jgi:hypothetical protein
LRDFGQASERARYLGRALVERGRYETPAGAITNIPATDQRDIVAFIFLEVSAKFESFVYLAFQYDICKSYRITSTRSEFVIGAAEGGTRRMFGWAVPERLANRGENLLTKESFFGALRENIGEPLYEILTVAHDLRNRVAHDPATAHSPITEMAIKLGVPNTERKGLSVGRLLREYPAGSNFSESYFETFLQAYEDFAGMYATY